MKPKNQNEVTNVTLTNKFGNLVVPRLVDPRSINEQNAVENVKRLMHVYDFLRTDIKNQWTFLTDVERYKKLYNKYQTILHEQRKKVNLQPQISDRWTNVAKYLCKESLEVCFDELTEQELHNLKSNLSNLTECADERLKIIDAKKLQVKLKELLKEQHQLEISISKITEQLDKVAVKTRHFVA